VSPNPAAPSRFSAPFVAVAGGVVAVVVALLAVPAAAQPDRPTPSGLPVPRWVSLKSSQINARVGPGNDYRILWTYRTRGLPVQVIAETRDWRRVCDPRGGVAWVNAGTTTGRRMVMRTKAQPLAVRAKPDAAAQIRAYVAGRSLAGLDRCKDGWCKVKLDGASGWIPAQEVWGTDERQQCRPNR
jgi:SH3-like domain-containing protein